MLRTSFQIVLGTHDATPVPAAARAHGLTQRFALVQSTHAPGVADMLVDSSALLVLLRTFDMHLASAGRLYWDRARRRRERVALASLTAYYRTTPQEEHEPLTGGEWLRGQRLVALLHTERWANVGGPAPYHDSLTYSFYTAEDCSHGLLDALRAADCEPSAILTATSAPRRTGWLARLRGFLLASPHPHSDIP